MTHMESETHALHISEENQHCSHDHSHDEHHHEGHHHHHVPTEFGKAFATGIIINLVYVGTEALWGVWADSLSLIADAGHNLSDVLALACAWIAAILSKRRPSVYFTYGLRRSSILASLINAVALLVVTGGIIWEAISRLLHPVPVEGWTIIIVAAIGVLVNGFTAMLFMSGSKGDLNIKGAFLHMAYDALLSLAVVVTGIIIIFTDLYWLDPIVSLIVAFTIILGTWSLLRDSLNLALDRVPQMIDPKAVEQFLRSLPGIVDLHDLHIWPMSTTETALTVHLVRNQVYSSDELLHQAAKELKEHFKIDHATFQLEWDKEAQSCMLAHIGSV
ncbi:MAG: cation diffusion facilitator family transporter [Commensalibacter sp.]